MLGIRFAFLVCHLETVLSSPGWPGTCYVAEDGIELEIYLLLPLKCWDYSYAPRTGFHAVGYRTQSFMHTRQTTLPTEPPLIGHTCFLVAVKWSREGCLRHDWGFHTRSRDADYASQAYMSGLLLFFTGVTTLKIIQKTLSDWASRKGGKTG